MAERSGFKGLWASGLSIASSLGFRDANEASWSQLVESVERIVDSAELPVLVDGDGGFGNFNPASLHASFARLARRTCRLRTAASRR
nr:MULTISPECIES: isocitrate lyase/phosphoenolpyruvate mutase family protein [unclassified Bradyrhizobium]